MTTSPASSRSALVVGAGIAGLSAALCLRQRGWEVQVAEQAEQLNEVGAGLQISPNGCKVLDALGLLEAVQQRAFAPVNIEMRLGRSGRSIFSIPLRETALQRWGAPYLHIHRADLLEILYQAARVAGITVHTGRRFQRYVIQDQTVLAAFADGSTIKSSILLGADGLHSALREQMLGPEQPRFTGCLAWRLLVPTQALGNLAPPPSACVWVGHRRHAVTYRLRGGELCNFVGVVEARTAQEESWTRTGNPAALTRDFGDWHPILSGMIEHGQAPLIWPLYDRHPLPRWTTGPVALLGDACHPMLPFMAQGAVMALEDAWVLAASLASDGRDFSTGLTLYQDRRQRRCQELQSTARRNQSRFHKPDWSYAPLALAAKVNPQAFHRMQDWIYGEDVVRRYP